MSKDEFPMTGSLPAACRLGTLVCALALPSAANPAQAQAQYQAQAQTPYATPPDVLLAAPERSAYTVQTDGSPRLVDPAAFLREAGRDAPVVVQLHGCYGVNRSDRLLRDFFAAQGANVVVMDYLALPGRARSCALRPEPQGWPEASNPQRIRERRAEMEAQVDWLKAHGFRRIFVSGHSEGGRTAQGLQAEVAGVFIHGMDCKAVRRAFWHPNPRNRIRVFLSERDPWLGYPLHPIRGCSGPGRGAVTDHWSSQPTHSPLVEPAWRELIAHDLAP